MEDGNMNKKCIFLVFMFVLICNTISYAECNHSYEKEYNYSFEVKNVVGQHYYRQRCSICGEVEATSNIQYEPCNYKNSTCIYCKDEQHVMPKYSGNFDLELQEYLYGLCVENDLELLYNRLLGYVETKSNFDSNLRNGIYIGLFQLNAAYDYSWLLGRKDYDLLNPKDNIEIGVKLYDYYYRLNDKFAYPALISLEFGMASKEMEDYYVMED